MNTVLFSDQDVEDAFFARSVDNTVLGFLGLGGTRRSLPHTELVTALLDIIDEEYPNDYVYELTGRKPKYWEAMRERHYQELVSRYQAGQEVLKKARFVSTERYTSNAHGDFLCEAENPVDSPWVQVTAGHVAATQAYRCIALKRKEG